jgi:hypothetical protein
MEEGFGVLDGADCVFEALENIGSARLSPPSIDQ